MAVLQNADIQFNVDGKQVKFSVHHDMGEVIHSAVDNWLARTKVFTGESFCKYVNSKGVYKCKLV